MARKKILVTGGAGFIGGNVTRALLEAGYQVVVLDNLSTGDRRAVPASAKFIKGDIRRPADLDKAMAGADAVIHMAAKLEASESFEIPEEYYETNLIGTLNVLQAMRRHKVKKIIFSSTATVYDAGAKMPVTEKSPLKPTSPYGTSKLACEHLLDLYYRQYGIDLTIFRYFNVYGPGDYNEYPHNAVPRFTMQALRGQALTIFGDGSMIRDYIYVGDLARAHLLALKLKGFQLYNLSTGKGTSNAALAKAILNAVGSAVPCKHLPIPPGYPAKVTASYGKILRELKWKPRVGLEEGLKEVAKFHLKLRKSKN